MIEMVMAGGVGGAVAAAVVWLVLRRRAEPELAPEVTEEAPPVSEERPAGTARSRLRARARQR